MPHAERFLLLFVEYYQRAVGDFVDGVRQMIASRQAGQSVYIG